MRDLWIVGKWVEPVNILYSRVEYYTFSSPVHPSWRGSFILVQVLWIIKLGSHIFAMATVYGVERDGEHSLEESQKGYECCNY
jgi:hypothetical protein